ncbi:hypothetical protein ElyMa_005956200 [Elysia marginata]|uniref:Uncharacterized protein n=1 Tax=Elysia marginata TaxID=1093978 RepID=A0AAV4G9Z6_9GAST|nr:hypothetical protein ElyMa_005956200 [Elysia marginata]
MLQSYYTSAVRTYNSSTEVVSKAIWAAFYLSVSTADQPQHENCPVGKTQNSNESLHSVIWAKCPKHTFSGLQRIKIGVTVAVGEYNMGSLGSHFFFPAVGCALTTATTSLGQKRDKRRIYKAEIAHQAPAKKRIEVRKRAQQRAQQAATRAEGGPSYVSGGF